MALLELKGFKSSQFKSFHPGGHLGKDLQKVNKLAAGGHAGAKDLATYWGGQGVGLMNQSISASDVVQEFKEDFISAYERLNNFVDE